MVYSLWFPVVFVLYLFIDLLCRWGVWWWGYGLLPFAICYVCLLFCWWLQLVLLLASVLALFRRLRAGRIAGLFNSVVDVAMFARL